jgi:hypothetical protein
MNHLTQKEKFLKEEELAVGEIASLQLEIDFYKNDLKKIRKHLADLENGKNDNAWESYTKEVLY